jgi:hypothetical protein
MLFNSFAALYLLPSFFAISFFAISFHLLCHKHTMPHAYLQLFIYIKNF